MAAVPDDRFDAVIVAAGSGTRLGFSTPKAFVPVAGKPMLQHSVEVFSAHPSVSRLILVVPASLVDETERRFQALTDIVVTEGGAERWESVRNGCSVATSPWVLIHDAARPLLTTAVIDSLLALRQEYRCAFTATPVVDTIRTFSGTAAGETIDRSTLVRVGTPQMFDREVLMTAFSHIHEFATPPTDEVMLVQKTGIPAGIASGDPNNFKITTKEDLEVAEALLSRDAERR